MPPKKIAEMTIADAVLETLPESWAVVKDRLQTSQRRIWRIKQALLHGGVIPQSRTAGQPTRKQPRVIDFLGGRKQAWLPELHHIQKSKEPEDLFEDIFEDIPPDENDIGFLYNMEHHAIHGMLRVELDLLTRADAR
jgi:hypothetical protein